MEKDIIDETMHLISEQDYNDESNDNVYEDGAYDSFGDITIDTRLFSDSGEQDVIQSLEYVADYLQQYGIYTKRYGEYFEVDDAKQLDSISNDVKDIITKLQDFWRL